MSSQKKKRSRKAVKFSQEDGASDEEEDNSAYRPDASASYGAQ